MSNFLVPRNLGDLWIHACSYICTYVRTDFLRNRRIRFFWFFWCKKMAVSLFCGKLKIGPFLAKMAKIWSFLAKNSISFLKLTLNFLYAIFIWNIFSQILSQYFIYHAVPCDQILAISGGSCCVKMTKNGSKSTFLEPYLVSCIRDIA